MAVNEVSSLIRYKDENGNHNILYPITTKDNVDGIDDIEAAVAETVKYTAQTLSANQKAQARANIGAVDSTYVDNAIDAIPEPDVNGPINSHNTATTAHNDIRILINGLTTRLNTLANSDDATLDQMSEIVAYIKNNKSLIEGVTTNKVNVSDIINNLTTNVANKPLSAAQGVAIKALIDALDSELDKKVTLDTAQTITGIKTFAAPANADKKEQTTVKFKTSNGGAIIFGKESANSGTMMRLDQSDGTVRLRFRGSKTAGAMVWEQPEQGAALFMDLGKEGVDKHRISFPSSAGTLALTSQVSVKADKDYVDSNIGTLNTRIDNLAGSTIVSISIEEV